MTSRILSLCLLLSCGTNATSRAPLKPIKLESPMIKAIDGTPFVHIGNMMYIGKQLSDMLNKKPCLYFAYDDTYRTITELRDLEAYYTSLGAIDNELQKAFDKARHQALHTFVQISHPYVEEIKAVKSTMLHIISDWNEKRKRSCGQSDTHLLAWASLEGDEEEALYKNVTDFASLSIFVDDLRTFLMDLIYNFEESYKQWKQQHNSRH